MAIDNPVGVFTAETNLEAQVIANLLKDAGIEAAAIEDISPAGMYSLGTLDQIHKPKVFVTQEDLDPARKVIARYQGRGKGAEKSLPASCCYFCGTDCEVDATRCPACGQMLEEEDEAGGNESDAANHGVSSKSMIMGGLRSIKRVVAFVILAPLLIYVGFVLILVVANVLGVGR